jgi:hypothetical protein
VVWFTQRFAVTASIAVGALRVGLCCMLCGRAIGTPHTRSWPAVSPLPLRVAGTGSIVTIADWSQLRCPTCGGNVYADEVTSFKVYPEVSWADDAPRRGRPPKSLVARRRVAGSIERT